MAVVLQSSTAVAFLAAGFAGGGTLSLSTSLTLMLGADLGSAIAVQILSIDLHWVIPLLLVAGGGLFFKGWSREHRQLSRVLIGIALILVSLRMIAEATTPLREAALLPAVVGYLFGDFINAFLIGAAFTWLVHSSVATILLIAAFAGQGLVPLELGGSLVLGANFGAGLIAIGLTRQSCLEARRMAWGNLMFRGIGAIAALLVIHLASPSLAWLGNDPARQVINLHLVFNVLLLAVCLPLTGPVARFTTWAVRSRPTPGELDNPLPEAASCLDHAVTGVPALALASATRELLRMAEIIERMLKPLMDIYETGDPDKIRQARQMERAVDQAQSDIKLYLARIDYGDAIDDAPVATSYLASPSTSNTLATPSPRPC